MTQITRDDERGIDFPAMTVADHEGIDDKLKEELRERTLGLDAMPVVFPILATQPLNAHIAVSFRGSLQKGMWTFLQSENEIEDFLIKTYRDFMTNDSDSYRAFYLSPYFNTTLFIGECINLDMSLTNGVIKLSEKEGNYKDRYTSVSYLNYVAGFFDIELLKEQTSGTDWEAILAVSNLM
jgi:hypothetical protein